MSYNTQVAVFEQREFCKRNKLPCFIPVDGICYRCHESIFSKNSSTMLTHGISVEEASLTMITCCPHCNYSFLD